MIRLRATLLVALLACGSDEGGGGTTPDAAVALADAAPGGADAASGEADAASGAADATPGGGDAAAGEPDAAAACAPTEHAVENQGWSHVAELSVIAYGSNPPASGPHYPVWGKYREHATPLARGYWVHNLEHRAVIFLYRPDAPQPVKDALIQAYRALPNDPLCGHKRALLTADPELDVPVAIVAADFALESDCVSTDAITAFVNAHRGKLPGPENVCADGSIPSQ